MADGYKPGTRERALVEAARAAVERGRSQGRRVSAELIRRMASEEDVAQLSEQISAVRRRWKFEFNFAVEVLFKTEAPAIADIAKALIKNGCIGVGPFRGQGPEGRTFSLQFAVWSPSGEYALRNAFDAVLAAFPDAMVGAFEWPNQGRFPGLHETSTQGDSVDSTEAAACGVGHDFRVTMCVSVAKKVPRVALLEALAEAGCNQAACFPRRPILLVADFTRFATSQAEADATALGAVRELFGDAGLMPQEAVPGSTIEALCHMVRNERLTQDDLEVAVDKLEGIERTASGDEFASTKGRVEQLDIDLQVQRSKPSGSTTSRPAPPVGFASWLDYAVFTMDVRSVALDASVSADSAPTWTSQEMRRAARDELSALRALVGRLSR